MKPYEQAHTRAFVPEGFGNQPFFGGPESFPYQGGNPFGGAISPFGGGQFPSQALTTTPANGGGSSFNFAQIKGMIDKMGGIEGIIGTMAKLQKIFASIQQMAPMLKLLMKSFGGPAKAATKSVGRSPVRRKQTTRRPSSASARSRQRPRRR